jgi:hypothetical protein
MKIEGKITVWQRLEIPDSAREALNAFLTDHPEASFDELYDWAHEQNFDPHCETLEGTSQALDRAENGGYSTIEIKLDNGAKIWNN